MKNILNHSDQKAGISRTFWLTSMVLLFTISGCTKFVQADAPITQVATSSVFENNATATAAQLVVYTKMTDPATINRMTGLSSDELFTYATDQISKDLYANALTAITDGGIAGWTNFYSYIYFENSLLEALPNSMGVDQKVKQQLLGEASFVRAYLYFYLLNLYGDVPLVTTTDYKANSILARTPQSLVYKQILTDLNYSKGLLNSNYVDATDTTTTTEKGRPTSWAAAALLARVYLYINKPDSAEMQATTVINNSKFRLCGLDSVFLKNSDETIWQIIPSITQGYTPEGNFFVITKAPGTGQVGSNTINPQLLNAFESGDQRKNRWISTFSGGTNSYVFPSKYKKGAGTAAPASEYSMILRLAEQYLIRAEARVQQNNLPGAIADLNMVRARAGFGPNSLPNTLSKDQVITAIAHERQVELFTEGHRWFDLKRTQTIDNVMTIATPKKGGIWDKNQQLYPISTLEISRNTNIIQNLGY